MGTIVQVPLPPQDSSAAGPGEDDFWQMLAALRPALFGAAFGLTRQDADADDLVQQTLEKAYRQRHRFDGRNLMGWCATILKNEFRDRLRQWWCRKVDGGIDDSVIIDLPNGEERVMLRQVIEVLQEIGGNCLEVLLLTAKGFKLREMSDLLNIPIGTLGRQVFECRHRLDRKLGLEGKGH